MVQCINYMVLGKNYIIAITYVEAELKLCNSHHLR